jgi:hypothetical protein
MLLAYLSMEILAASLTGIGGQKGIQDYPLDDQEETPAEDRTLGLLAFFAIFPAVKKWFLQLFSGLPFVQ